MKVHVFSLEGKYAHWRRIYTNSSSLSYFYPSRTNIIGMIASVLKRDYDSYYNEFSSENLNIGVSIESNLKKQMTLFNYRCKKKGNIQVRCEILSEINNNKIRYNIYLLSKDEKIEREVLKLIQLVKNNDLGYGIYLGQRQHKGFLEYINSYKFEMKNKHNIVNSVCPINEIYGTIDLDNEYKYYNKDLIPIDFDEKRQLITKKECLVELRKNEIKTKEGMIKDVYIINNKAIKFL